MEEVKEEKKEIIEDVKINSEFIELEAAEKKIKEMEELNKRLEDNLKKQERLAAETMLRGRGIAGQKPRTDEDDRNDEAEKIANAIGRSFKNNHN